MFKMSMLTFYSLIFLIACSNHSNISPSLTEFLNQTGIIENPKIFAPNLISRGYHELGISISNDEKEIFYIMCDRSYTEYILVQVNKNNNIWSEPRRAVFAQNLSVYSCCLTHDGKGLYFSTNKPVVWNGDTLKGTNNWFVNKKGSEWGDPKLINKFLNHTTHDRIQSISKYKNIYLSRNVSERKTDIYKSSFIDGKLGKPQPIKGLVNSSHTEGRPFIAPDESYLIFQSDRPGGFGSNDLWISFRDKNNIWGEPINLGSQINTSSSEFGPYVSPNGKHLFFSSYRSFDPQFLKDKSYDDLIKMYNSPLNGYATLYWIESKILEKLKTEKSK
jgi:WD40-like Beta Propeller Repeat